MLQNEKKSDWIRNCMTSIIDNGSKAHMERAPEWRCLIQTRPLTPFTAVITLLNAIPDPSYIPASGMHEP